MFKKIAALFNKPPQPSYPRYRITKYELGYLPEVDMGDMYGWEVVDSDGRDRVVTSVAVGHDNMFSPTEKEAGDRINTYNSLFVVKGEIIWTSH